MNKKVKKFFKRAWKETKDFIREEYKFLISIVVFYIICTWPVNYYIIVGGGITDVSDRVEVVDGYESKGSFNLCYVSELKGTTLTYVLSYIIPSWDRESMSDYKYSEAEDYEDLAFRGDLELKTTNNSAIKAAFDLADKEVIEKSSKIYVVANFDEYESELKIRDQLVSINDNKFNTMQEYSDYIQKYNDGDFVKVKVIRDKKEVELNCRIYEEEGRKIFGIMLMIDRKYETDPKVNISFRASESGPSGGLITALEMYNGLVKKDISNGMNIAGTGTIDALGNVGSIGGVRYKVIGADAGDADVFLVPKGKNYKEAMKVKKEKKLDIKIIGVSTLEETVLELSKLSKQ